MDTPTKEETTAKEIVVALTPDTAKPTFCNIVNFARMKNGNILLTFIFGEPDTSNRGTVVTRIVVDEAHAKEIIKVMGSVLKSSKTKK